MLLNFIRSFFPKSDHSAHEYHTLLDSLDAGEREQFTLSLEGKAGRAGPHYAVFDWDLSILEFCRKRGLPWSVIDGLALAPMRRASISAEFGIPSFVCGLPDGMVLGRSFIPATGDGHAFPFRCIHNVNKINWPNAPDYFDTLRLASPRHLLVKARGQDFHPGKHVLIGSHDNFGHWMLNHFARLRLVEEMPALQDARVIVGDNIRPTHLQCLLRAGISPDRICYLSEGRIATFEELWVPSLLLGGIGDGVSANSLLYWTPELLSFIRRRLRLDFPAKPWRRLYVTRAGAKWRRLINDDEIASMLANLGFQIVDPGSLSLDEQIDLAASSQIIVGTFGAGLNLLLFAPEGTPVVEIKYDLGGTMDINWHLTSKLGQPYYEIFGAAHETNIDPTKYDFEVSAEAVVQQVQQALISANVTL